MSKKFFVTISALVIITGLITFSCKKNSSNTYTAPPDTTNQPVISMHNMTFIPAMVTVTKGTVIKWKNNDTYAHTVDSNDGITFSSGNISGGGSFTYTATVAGTFNYHCLIHGLPMSGIVIVNP
jgi:plastocyanin